MAKITNEDGQVIFLFKINKIYFAGRERCAETATVQLQSSLLPKYGSRGKI